MISSTLDVVKPEFGYFWSQGACVQNVLDSLVPALLKDENRKFIYVEQVSKFPSDLRNARKMESVKLGAVELGGSIDSDAQLPFSSFVTCTSISCFSE